jgi:sugar phosphate isomerase/epimerase
MGRTTISRREFAAGVAGTAIVMPASIGEWAEASLRTGVQLCVFSKHLQWLGYEKMAELAAEIGFDGVDLTVRPGGHVPPEEAALLLPRAIRAVREAGLQVPMITTAITDAEDSTARSVLATASDLGVGYYRMGYYRYEEGKPIEQTLAEVRRRLEKLGRLNEELGICGDYQNHAGRNYFGASVWDLWTATAAIDPRWLGVQFDLRHATVEGAFSWPVDFRLIASRTHTLVAKDFRWARQGPDLKAENCPLGQGRADFPGFLELVRHSAFAGPISVHFEYPLGGAERGGRELSIDRDRLVTAMRSDLATLRAWLDRAGWKVK